MQVDADLLEEGDLMLEHFEKESGSAVRPSGPVHMRHDVCGSAAGIRLTTAVGVVVSICLACAVQARAGGPPQAPSGPALPGDARPSETPITQPAAVPDESVLLTDDDAAAVTDSDGQDVPWIRGVPLERRLAAREVFLEANALARKRFFATAAARYKQAIELWDHPAFAYNLALTQLQLDQLIEAYANLERAIAYGPAPLGDRYENARNQLALIGAELSPLQVACSEPGARVMLDGKLLFTGPGQYRGMVRPGAHQLVATRRGLTPLVEQIVTSPGEQASFSLVFEYPEVEISHRPWPAWRSYSVAGAGAVLLLAGVVLDSHSTRMFDDYTRDFRSECPTGCPGAMRPRALDERRARAETEQRAAVITYVAGGAVLTTSLVLTYFGRERTTRRRVQPALDESPAPRPSVAPLVTPGVIGLSAGARF
jgi:hypothetical protein